MLFLVLDLPGILPVLFRHGKVFLNLQISGAVLTSPKFFPYCSPNLTPRTARVGASYVPPLYPLCFLSDSSHMILYLSHQFIKL